MAHQTPYNSFNMTAIGGQNLAATHLAQQSAAHGVHPKRLGESIRRATKDKKGKKLELEIQILPNK